MSADLIKELRAATPENTLMITDTGNHQTWVEQYWDAPGPQMVFTPGGFAVWCEERRCTISGGESGAPPGEIRDARYGVYLERDIHLEMSHVVVRDCTSQGIAAEDWSDRRGGSKAHLVDVRVTGCEGVAVEVGRLTLERVLIDANPGSGIGGASSPSIVADGLTVTGNAFSAGCQINGCEGIDVHRLRGCNVVVTDNAGLGIHARRVSLKDSVVTGNVRAGVLKDVVTAKRPALKDVECGRSLGWGTLAMTPWGVCALDSAL